MEIKTMTVTPALARDWLKLNKENRALRPNYIQKLAESMKRGEWTLTHQPIAMGDGRLLDGQHRLLAFLESGLPKLQMSVAIGVPAQTFDVIDVGINRSHADIYREDKFVIHPISLIGRLVYGTKITARELHPVYDAFAPAMRKLAALHKRGTPKLTVAGIKVGCWAAVLDGEDEEYVLNMYHNFCEFDTDNVSRAVGVFLKQLTLDANVGGRAVHSSERYQAIVRSFTVFHRANARLTKIQVKDTANRIEQIRKLYVAALERAGKKKNGQ